MKQSFVANDGTLFDTSTEALLYEEQLKIIMARKLTPEDELLLKDYMLKLKEIQLSDDTEHIHSEEDALLCDLLIYLGFKDLVYLYKSTDKYYA